MKVRAVRGLYVVAGLSCLGALGCEFSISAGTKRTPPPAAAAAPAPAPLPSPRPAPVTTTAPPPTPTPPPAIMSSFTATGTFRGAPFTLDCRQFSPKALDKDAAFYASPGMVFVSCHTDPSGVAVNVTISKLAPGDIVPQPYAPQAGGRVGIAQGNDQLSSDTAGATSKINVSTWDPNTKHLVGSVTMTWPADSSGKAGSLTGKFDLVNIQNPQ